MSLRAFPTSQVFPLRLMLRLGAHEKYYPCPIVGERYRKPLYAEIGHTIINLLADFRNYQYTLPQIKGVLVHMEDKKTVVRLPSNRFVVEILENIEITLPHFQRD